ncbi:hypothetical protein [Bacillus infantis]|uniref:hypothetical protein n=1 Tax=Bacillus infantis TaxID=324767 RepID=UPI003CF76A46
MKFFSIFASGLALFIMLIAGLLLNTTDGSEKDGIGFLIILGTFIYIPILFIIALVIQFSSKNTK